jgi:predicted nucleotidyltransferase
MGIIQTKEELLNILLHHKDEIKNFGVVKVGLFGSFIKGKQNSESDVDFLIQFLPEKKNFRNFMNLAFFLEDLLNRKVEIVTEESLSPYLKPYIMQEVEYVLS